MPRCNSPNVCTVGDSFYVIVDGSCDIYHHSVRRSAKKVEEVEPIGFSGAQIQTASDRIQLGSRIGSIGAGDCFGELNLGFGDKRLATIVANGDGTGGKTILLQVDRQCMCCCAPQLCIFCLKAVFS